jgi:DedD protein
MGLFSFFGKKQQDADDDLDIPVRPRRSRAKSGDDEPMDPMLPEKKRARRRLIGATALVLAAIIGLPMIFDSEPKPLSNDIAIQIPPRDKSSATNASPMPLPPAQVPGEAPKADVKPDADAAVATTGTEPTKAAAAPSMNDSSAAAAKPVEARVDQLTDKPAVRKDEKRAENKSDKQADKSADSASSKSADKDKGRFIVQVAAVTNKAKVEELLNRLKKGGIKGYWQKITTKDGDRFRVRVGPFGSRDEAEKMSKRIDKLGLSGSVQSI